MGGTGRIWRTGAVDRRSLTSQCHLLDAGEVLCTGKSEEIVTVDRIRTMYRTERRILEREGGRTICVAE